MHGGSKNSLFCSFADCKRSSGSGFTRKENLVGHIRRVHQRASMSANLGHLVIPRPASREGSTAGEVRPSELPFQCITEVHEDDSRLVLKRKRSSDAGVAEVGDKADLRAEVKRLRRENEDKDVRLRQLEAAVMILQQNRR